MKLSIIILSYNTKELLKQTIDSIPIYSDWEIIVVDNASTDGSVEMLTKNYPNINLITNAHNRGFAAANNQGLQIAKGTYIQLLNSDTQIVADALEQLIQYLDTHPEVGMITPKVILPDGAIDLACHRGMPTPWNAFTYFTRLESIFPTVPLFAGYHQTYQDFNQPHPIEAVSCTAAIIRKNTVEQVGLLDERFFFYGEDLDWCKRIADAGWQIIYYPHAIVYHHKSQSGKKNQDKNTQRIANNHFYHTMKQFYQKHYTTKYPKWLRQLVFWGIDIKKKISS